MTKNGNWLLKSMISPWEAHFLFRNLILKLEKLRQLVTKYIETTNPLLPSSINVDESKNYTETLLWRNYSRTTWSPDIGKDEGVLNLYGLGFLRGSSGPRGGGWPPQYLGLYLSVANKTRQIYKTNQNKVIDIKKVMLTLQNIADVIKN